MTARHGGPRRTAGGSVALADLTAQALVALQAAGLLARDNALVCYLPLGTYKVSDTIRLNQIAYLRSTHDKALVGGSLFPNSFVGSREVPGKRPTIVLAEDSPGFGDAKNPKPVIQFHSVKVRRPDIFP